MSSPIFQEKQQQRITLSEVCSTCLKPKRRNVIASLTSWLFQASSCRCAGNGANLNLANSQERDCAASSSTTENLTSQINFGEDYEVISLLGQGGMGTVYQVKDRKLDRAFALKVLREDLGNDKIARKRFQHEVESASKLTHPNLVAVYGHGIASNDAPYLVMDCLEGESLDVVLGREGRIGEDRALDIFIQVAEGMAHAHAKGIIHKDLKPTNIFLTNRERAEDFVKILDFGIAHDRSNEINTKTITTGSDILGTPNYMSPEQCLGYQSDERSDIYSIGCVLFECLTGEPPFCGENSMQVVAQHLRTRVETTPGYSKLSRNLKAVVSRCLQKDANDRYQGANELLSDLLSIRARRKLLPTTSLQQAFFFKPEAEVLLELVGFSLPLILMIGCCSGLSQPSYQCPDAYMSIFLFAIGCAFAIFFSLRYSQNSKKRGSSLENLRANVYRALVTSSQLLCLPFLSNAMAYLIPVLLSESTVPRLVAQSLSISTESLMLILFQFGNCILKIDILWTPLFCAIALVLPIMAYFRNLLGNQNRLSAGSSRIAGNSPPLITRRSLVGFLFLLLTLTAINLERGFEKYRADPFSEYDQVSLSSPSFQKIQNEEYPADPVGGKVLRQPFNVVAVKLQKKGSDGDTLCFETNIKPPNPESFGANGGNSPLSATIFFGDKLSRFESTDLTRIPDPKDRSAYPSVHLHWGNNCNAYRNDFAMKLKLGKRAADGSIPGSIILRLRNGSFIEGNFQITEEIPKNASH